MILKFVKKFLEFKFCCNELKTIVCVCVFAGGGGYFLLKKKPSRRERWPLMPRFETAYKKKKREKDWQHSNTSIHFRNLYNKDKGKWLKTRTIIKLNNYGERIRILSHIFSCSF